MYPTEVNQSCGEKHNWKLDESGRRPDLVSKRIRWMVVNSSLRSWKIQGLASLGNYNLESLWNDTLVT